MARLPRHRARPDIWPGFVDALAALLMVMVFLLLVFVIGQFVLSDAVTGKDKALQSLNAQLAALAQALSLETEAKTEAQARAVRLAQDLEKRNQAYEAQARTVSELEGFRSQLQVQVDELAKALEISNTAYKEESTRLSQTRDELALLAAQLEAVHKQLLLLNEALEVAQKDKKEQKVQIASLDKALKEALAGRIHELNQYRSEFFGRLRKALGERSDIQIVADRFVFSSEVLFASASDEVSEEGLRQLIRLAQTLKEVSAQIPADLPWVLQVDGHTDRRPIATPRFPSNWELSTARALAIVRFLKAQGIPAERLAATGYGEFHPLDPKDTPQAHARNRRIELKLTNR
jgi:chemotaxis protein MotB